MKRTAGIVFAAWLVVIATFAASPGSRAQEPDYPATITAYETQVAKLESKVGRQATSIAKQQAKIEIQRARIADLLTPEPTATPAATATQVAPLHLHSFSGTSSTLTDTVSLTAGSYRVSGTVQSRDDFSPFFVNAYAPDGSVDFVIIATADRPGPFEASGIFIAPYEGDYVFEVQCNDRWTLTVDPV